jgi:WD40 repeat protein
VRSLPFSTDEFFAALRDCYNRRTQDPEFQRLTFCLLGVAVPSDLIQDTRTTPFNIGRRIDLIDFSAVEAAPLAEGLGREARIGRVLLERVLYWTGGHPYLTQRLCQMVAQNESVTSTSGVDRLCAELFLSPSAQEKDDNLLFVRERLLNSEAERAALLDLYGQVRSGKRVVLDDTNQLVSLLRLSGITHVAGGGATRGAGPRGEAGGGRLQVRNRIYERVFDKPWVTAHMPDAELRRQQAAFRRGLWRAAAVSAVVVMAMGALALVAVTQARRANEQRQVALAGQETFRRGLYVADISVALQAWQGGNVQRALELLKAHRPQQGEKDLRGFEWRYLWHCCHFDTSVTLAGHTQPVSSVAFSPDGKLLASGSEDDTLKLWDVRSRRPTTLRGHAGDVNSVAFSPDGRLLAAANKDGTVTLRDVATKRTVSTIRTHRPWVSSVAFSPDGKRLALASTHDGMVELWDVPARREIAILPARPLPGYEERVTWVAFSPNGKLLAEGRTDETVRFWDLATHQEVASIHSPWGIVFSGAFSPDGRLLATGHFQAVVSLWDVASRRPVAVLRGHRGGVNGVAFSPNGRLLASVSSDNIVKLWDIATQRAVNSFRGHRAEVTSVAFSPDGQTLATGSVDHTLKLWRVAASQEAETLKGHTERIWRLTFSHDSKTLATASYDHTVRLWDVATGRAATLKGFRQVVSGVAFSPDDRILATGTGAWNENRGQGELKLWNVARRTTGATLRGHPAPPGGSGLVFGVAFSPDGKTLASAGSDRYARLWNVASGQEFAKLRHPKRLWDVAFSPDGRILATACADSRVRLWDVAARRWDRARSTLSGHPAMVMCLAFSPDGRTLASGGIDPEVRVWDVATGRKRFTLEASRGFIPSVAFSPDGKTLASGNQDDSVTLWNLDQRRELASLQDAGSLVAFSPDGSTMATASLVDRTVRLWRADPFTVTDAEISGSLSRPTR